MGMAVLMRLQGPPQKIAQRKMPTMIQASYIFWWKPYSSRKTTVDATSSKMKKILLSCLLIKPQSKPPTKTPADQRIVTRTAYQPISREMRQYTIHDTMKEFTDLMNPYARTLRATPGSLHTVSMFTRLASASSGLFSGIQRLSLIPLGNASCQLPCERHSSFLSSSYSTFSSPCRSLTYIHSSFNSTCTTSYGPASTGGCPSGSLWSGKLCGMSAMVSTSMTSRQKLPRKKQDCGFHSFDATMMKKLMREMKSPNCDVPFQAESTIPFRLSKQSETIYRQLGHAVLDAIPTPRPKKTTQSHCAVKSKLRKIPTRVLKASSAASVNTRKRFAPHCSTLLPRMFMKMAMTKRTTMSMVPKNESQQSKGAVVRLLLIADHMVLSECTTAQLTSVTKQMRHFTCISLLFQIGSLSVNSIKGEYSSPPQNDLHCTQDNAILMIVISILFILGTFLANKYQAIQSDHFSTIT